jgi:multicomponent Na+:H+ antiporter subunit C
MHVVLAVTIGCLFAAAIYLMLRRSLAKLIIGLSILTNATNLLIFTVGGLTRAQPPLVPEGAEQPPTAIVIGFGVLAFMMVLAYRTYVMVGSDDLDDMVATDALAPRQLPYRSLRANPSERPAPTSNEKRSP